MALLRKRAKVEIEHDAGAYAPGWDVPDRFNFVRDVVEVLGMNPLRSGLTFVDREGIVDRKTFHELAGDAARWAHLLRTRLERGDRALIAVGKVPAWHGAMLGALKSGVVAVPCPDVLRARDLAFRIRDSRARLVVADRSLEVEVEEMRHQVDESVSVLYLDEALEELRRYMPVAPTEDTSASETALILYTSGTTKDPRGAVHTHAYTWAQRSQAAHWLDAHEGDVVWCTAGTGWSKAIWNSLLGPWSQGAEVVVHESQFDPEERLSLLHRLGVTILCQTPTEYRMLGRLEALGKTHLPRLRHAVSAGEPLNPEVIAGFQDALGLTIYDGYGQTENSLLVANTPAAPLRPGSMGLPTPGHDVAVIDESGQVCPPGVEGDLALMGRPPTLFAGYWEAPEETEAAFRDGWYVTGDRATRDEDGQLWFAGRADDVIVSSGYRIGPFEVESALDEHPAVAESAVVGVPDADRGQIVKAFVVLRSGQEPTTRLADDLQAHVKAVTAPYKYPREIAFVDELPRTASGKLQRGELRERHDELGAVPTRPLALVPESPQPDEPKAPVGRTRRSEDEVERARAAAVAAVAAAVERARLQNEEAAARRNAEQAAQPVPDGQDRAAADAALLQEVEESARREADEAAEAQAAAEVAERARVETEELARAEAEEATRRAAAEAAERERHDAEAEAERERAEAEAAERARVEAEAEAAAAERTRVEAEAAERALAEKAEEQSRLDAEAAAERERLEAEQRARAEAEAVAAAEHARLEAEAAAERERLEAEQRARVEAEAVAAAEHARLEAEAAAERERLEAEQRARAEAEAAAAEQARLETAERERLEAEAAAAEHARLEAEAAAEQERLEAEQRARAEAEAAAAEHARLEAEAAAERERLEAEQRARAEAEAAAAEQARLETAERERLEAEAAAAEHARLEAEAAAEQERLEAEAAAAEQARLEAEAAAAEQARLEAEAAAAEQARLEAEAAAERERAEAAEGARREAEVAAAALATTPESLVDLDEIEVGAADIDEQAESRGDTRRRRREEKAAAKQRAEEEKREAKAAEEQRKRDEIAAREEAKRREAEEKELAKQRAEDEKREAKAAEEQRKRDEIAAREEAKRREAEEKELAKQRAEDEKREAKAAEEQRKRDEIAAREEAKRREAEEKELAKQRAEEERRRAAEERKAARAAGLGRLFKRDDEHDEYDDSEDGEPVAPISDIVERLRFYSREVPSESQDGAEAGAVESVGEDLPSSSRTDGE